MRHRRLSFSPYPILVYGSTVEPSAILVCCFTIKPYTVLYLNIVFTLIRNFRTELYQWLYWRCQITVNKFLSTIPDDVRNSVDNHLLISAQNSLSSKEFAPELFIQDFDFNRYTYDESVDQITFRILTAYVDRKIKCQLFPILREFTGDNTIGHTNVGIAARASYPKVQKSLKRAGYNDEKTKQYMFFFNRFKEVRNSEISPSQLAINEWTEDNYQRVADRYNEIKPEHWERIKGAQARTMLEEIGQAIRDYEKSFIASRTVNIDDHSIESKVISPEYDRSFTSHLCDFIRDLLPRLDRKSNPKINRGIIFAILNHGFDIDQRQIAEQYGINQSNVSRPLNELYKEIANMYFKSCHTQASSEKLALFIKLLKNKAVDGIEVDMPILSRIFVDDFEQIFEQFFRAYIVTSTTIIEMKTNIMISKVEHQYNINLDEVDKNYLSHWIEKKLNHP
ncbi:MAG: hypothetical protein HEQ27_11580 [Dolichospermum sp. JUN01]|nr:hypothetical protein [Dolichospermum sp. JUN01]